MNLDMFLAQAKKDLEAFEKKWREENKVNVYFPLTLGNMDEWYEQFYAFGEMVED